MVAVDVLDATGVALMQAMPRADGFIGNGVARQQVRIKIALPPMIPGQYFATIWLGWHHAETLDVVERAIRFEIHESPTSGRSYQHSADHGHIVPLSTASCDFL
jgi:hypothetical protein